jgi:hypothetical protein
MVDEGYRGDFLAIGLKRAEEFIGLMIEMALEGLEGCP